MPKVIPQQIVAEKEKLQRQPPPPPKVITPSAAKKLLKESAPPKPMSEAQSEHVKKLIEANRVKWAAKKQAVETEAALKEKLESGELVEVQVAPKRVYPPRKKAPEPVPVQESEEDLKTEVAVVVEPPKPQKKKKIVYVSASESEESEEEVEIVKKPKRKTVSQSAVRDTIKEVEKLNAVISNAQPVNRYSSLLRW